MRIAFSSQHYPIVNTGSNKYATYITRGLAALGHDITVFATQTSDATEVLAAIITALEDKQNGRITTRFSKTALHTCSWERTTRLTSKLYGGLQVKR